jgi:hydrophobic/amphiphilic exporter-1 (mainly G- bacteria), HAE1 family
LFRAPLLTGTALGLTGTALGLTGSGGFISRPLGVVVIGGLISSTALTLVLVPTLYAMVENAKERVRRRRGGPGPDVSAQRLGAQEADRVSEVLGAAA